MIPTHKRFPFALLCLLLALALFMAGTVSPAAAQSGTTPILVLVNDAASNKFGRYYGEILRAEGLNSYDTATISAMPNLALYKVVLLAETTLNSGQAAALTSYVNGGGYLIAMRPDPQLAGILGLGAAQGTQTNGYLQLAGTGPSQGLATSTLQIHGTVDRYTLASGAVSLAQLFSNATTSTPYPAVVRSANGRGIAFTYDLAYNIVMMRQGNPANANVDTDGDGVLRTIDLFQGSGGGQPWVDLNRTSIPQADEQMRFLARLIQNAINASQPMPQLWYFPGTAKTVLVPTGDAHANPYSYFQDVLSSVTAHGGTMTVYLTEYAGNPSNNDVQGWRAQGHEFGIHPYASPQPADYTKLYTGYASADSFFRNRYASPSSRTVRNHQVTWVGWTDAAEIAAGFGMAMDTNFYHWGPWLQKGDGTWARGYITGSGQPMKFMKADGTVLPYFQQLTQLVDEQYFPIAGGFENLNIPGALAVSQALIDSSLAGDYAALMTQFHIDYDSWGEINGWVTGTLDYANSRGVPVLNADRWLGFTETRYNANYSNIAWNAASSTLTFNLASPATPGVTLSTILPLNYGGNGLQSVTVDGSPAGFTVQTIKGVNVAFVTTAAGNHSLSAVYQGPPFEATPTSTPTSTPTNTPITPPTITPSVTPTLDPSVTASPTPTNTPAPPPVTGCFIDDTVADFSLGTTAGTFVTNDGSVSLSPLLGERFDGSSLPDGWAAAPWVGGGTTTVSGGALTVNGTRAYTTTGYGAGTTLEFVATFQPTPWQHAGWSKDADFSGVWAIFSTFNTTTSLYARTSDGTNTLIPGNWLGSPHRFRIQRTAAQAIFAIDGAIVATHNFAYSDLTEPIASDVSADALGLSLDWLTITPYAASGSFTSRVFDAGAAMDWSTVTWDASGTSVSVSARSGNTPAPDGSWSAFTPVTASGASLGLSGRYLQYQLALSTADTAASPLLNAIGFACSQSTGQLPTPTSTNLPTSTPLPPPTTTPSPTPTNTPVPPSVAGCFIDDTVADFSLGTTAGTFVTNNGSVSLSPLLGERFDGTALPAGWITDLWDVGGGTTVASNALNVNGAWASTSNSYGAGTTLEFVATFQPTPWQHVGWSKDNDFNSPWAIFSTFNTTTSLYARTSDGTNTLIPGNWLGSPHRFRIQRTAAQAIFAIDGAIVATHNFAYGDLISPIVSDAAADSLSLALDWLTITPYAASGSFTSRVFDAGAAMDWSTVTWDASGTSVSISARSGNTPAPDGSWSAFTPVTASGASLGLSGRYLQYQLALSTADTAASPLLNAIGFACGQSANLPPVITASQTSLVINEGQTASNSGTVSDPNGSAVTLSASLGTVTNLGNGTWSWSYNASDNLAATVTITATDPQGAQSQVAFNLSVNNVAPSATFTNLSGVIQAGQSATLAFTNATDPGSQDTAAGFLYSYDCTNSGTFVLTDSTSSTFNCPYPTSGVFTARGRIADKDGGSTIYTVEVTVQDAPVTPPTGTPTATPTQTPTSTPTPTPTSTPPASTPQTVTFQINSGVNDVNEDGTSFNNSNSTIWIGNAASATASYAGLRFTNVTIPAGATINSAFLQVYSTQSQWITINLRLAADASDNSAAFSANSRPSQRPLTNQRVAHASNVLWNANTWYNLDDMSPVIQEVVSRPGWQSGNSLSVIIQGTSAGSWARKFFRSFNGGATTAPRLIVTFTTSGGTQGAPAVVLPEDGITPTPVVLPTLVPTSTLAPTETPFVVTPTAVPTETATLPPTETPAPPTDIPPTATPPVEASPIPLPTASFTASGDTGAAPFTVQFFNQSGGDISAYSWNFGDGGTSADANPVYTFNLPGSYVVTLTVTGPGGTASTAMTITVTG